MKNNIILLLSLLCFPFCVHAQKTTFPKGGYKDFEEFRKKQPSITNVFNIKLRTKSDIMMNGGNDYKVTSDSVDKSTIKRHLFAVSDGDTLFINCALHKAQWWYAKVIVEGKYLAFWGGIGPLVINNNASVGYAFGAVGGAFAGAATAMARYLYALDTDDGELHLLNEPFLNLILKNYPEIDSLYQKEPKTKSTETLLKYIRLVNSK